jgi:hydrogenase maturation protease
LDPTNRLNTDGCAHGFSGPASGVIIVGYGNELRGDDAAGPRIARATADWGIEGLESLACHQLLPELAHTLARKEFAVFVDASLDSESKDVSLELVVPAVSNSMGCHLSDPGCLLALSQALYGRAPLAWLVRVPASQWDLGANCSALAQHNMVAALTRIRQLLCDINQRRASRHA